MGNVFDADHVQGGDPCGDLRKGYIKCMKVNYGRAPDPYEPEWCEAEKEAYVACRKTLQKEKQ